MSRLLLSPAVANPRPPLLLISRRPDTWPNGSSPIALPRVLPLFAAFRGPARNQTAGCCVALGGHLMSRRWGCQSCPPCSSGCYRKLARWAKTRPRARSKAPELHETGGGEWRAAGATHIWLWAEPLLPQVFHLVSQSWRAANLSSEEMSLPSASCAHQERRAAARERQAHGALRAHGVRSAACPQRPDRAWRPSACVRKHAWWNCM
jgi:hypothetical protein